MTSASDLKLKLTRQPVATVACATNVTEPLGSLALADGPREQRQ